MDTIIKQTEIIERMDRLIRLQATGAPEKFATKLGISKTKLYRMIKVMKQLDAPVSYDITVQSFIYEKNVGFRFGFYAKEYTKEHRYSVG